MDKMLNHIANTATATPEPDDYIENGLLYCGKCHTPKQCKTTWDGHERIVPCMCKCREEEYNATQKQIDIQQQQQRIEWLREVGITDGGLLNCTFDKAYLSEEIQRCKAYVDNWEQSYENNVGLLMHGDAGTGKTFAAACIANALIDNGISAMITSFPRILSSNYDRTELLEQIRSAELVVIDDLGTERSSEYALEIAFLVIDERYKSKKPLIVTTNMTEEFMVGNKKNTPVWRIYQRILEMCVPMTFGNTKFRASIAKGKRSVVATIFEMKNNFGEETRGAKK